MSELNRPIATTCEYPDCTHPASEKTYENQATVRLCPAHDAQFLRLVDGDPSELVDFMVKITFGE